MKDLATICVSLELAWKLRDAGYSQKDSLFYWYQIFHSGEWECTAHIPSIDALEKNEACAAPTAEEIISKLPKWIKTDKYYCLTMDHFGNGISVNYENRNKVLEVIDKAEGKEYQNILHSEEDRSLANAAAKMYVYL